MGKISVIIRNRNEEAYIGMAIQSVIDQFDDPEIIIMDNNSTDDSIRVISLFDRYNIKVHELKGFYTPGKSINQAVKCCTNETILILSAHAQITDIDYRCIQEDLHMVSNNYTFLYDGSQKCNHYWTPNGATWKGIG